MTDRELLRAMFSRAGVVFDEDADSFEVRANDGPANLGYYDFCSVFGFRDDGSLESIGSWEGS